MKILEYTYVGKRNGNPASDIILGSVGIQPNHAIFINDGGKIFLEACDV